MTPPRPVLLLALLLVAGRAAAFPQTLTNGPATLDVRSDWAGETLSLADRLGVTLTVEGGRDLQVDPPRTLAAGPAWMLVERREPTRDAVPPGRVRWRQVFVVAPMMAGTQPWQFPPVYYRDGTDWQEAVWPSVEITVTALAAKGPLRDITAIEEVPPAPPPGPSWLWFLVLLPVGVLAGLIVLFRARSARSTTRDPAARTLALLQRLVARKLPEQGRGERFVTLLTLLLRRYFEQRYGVPARRRTTAEFLHALAGSPELREEDRKFLAAFLPRCDLIKFAKAAAPPDECYALADEVRRFVAPAERGV